MLREIEFLATEKLAKFEVNLGRFWSILVDAGSTFPPPTPDPLPTQNKKQRKALIVPLKAKLGKEFGKGEWRALWGFVSITDCGPSVAKSTESSKFESFLD